MKEVWLRGPLPGMPNLLQPVAHALLQVREELDELLKDFPDSLLWEKPAGVASPGFHLQHLSGVLDRLFTYARGVALTAVQLQYLAAEGSPTPGQSTVRELVVQFHRRAEQALAQLQATDIGTLAQARTVGRSQLPSTLIGLYVHAAEHSTRHLGQLLVTVRVLRHQVSRPLEI